MTVRDLGIFKPLHRLHATSNTAGRPRRPLSVNKLLKKNNKLLLNFGSVLHHSSFITVQLLSLLTHTVSSWLKECEASKHLLQRISQQVDFSHHLLAACERILVAPDGGVIFNLPRQALYAGMIRVEPLSSHFVQETLHHMTFLQQAQR